MRPEALNVNAKGRKGQRLNRAKEVSFVKRKEERRKE